MTVKELIITVRNHRGKVLVPVTTGNDVVHLVAEKQNLIKWLRETHDETSQAPLAVYSYGVDNSLRLDINEHA